MKPELSISRTGGVFSLCLCMFLWSGYLHAQTTAPLLHSPLLPDAVGLVPQHPMTGAPYADNFEVIPQIPAWIPYAPAAQLGVIPQYTVSQGRLEIKAGYGWQYPGRQIPVPLGGILPPTGAHPTVDAALTNPQDAVNIWAVDADLILARAGLIPVNGLYENFFQAVDLLGYGENLPTLTMGMMARVNTPAYLSTTGYLLSYLNREQVLAISRMESEIPSLLAVTHVQLHRDRRYRFVATGRGRNFELHVYDGNNLLEPIASARTTDSIEVLMGPGALGWSLVRGAVNGQLGAAGIAPVAKPDTGLRYPNTGASGILLANLDVNQGVDATFDDWFSTGNPDQLMIGFPGVPQVSELKPAPNSFFYPAGDGLSFVARTFFTNAPTLVEVRINGVPVPSADLEVVPTNLPHPSLPELLALAGNLLPREARSLLSPEVQALDDGLRVRYLKPLQANTLYRVAITLSAGSRTTTNQFSFDTFLEPGSVTIEAEDYNFGGGNYINNPVPSGQGGWENIFTLNRAPTNQPANGYYGKVGVPNVDYGDEANEAAYNLNLFGVGYDRLYYYYDFARDVRSYHRSHYYRYNDAVGTTQEANDTQRKKFTDAGITDYLVWLIRPGEWLQYTRNFPTTGATAYNVYLRASSLGQHHFRLHRIVSDRTAPVNTSQPWLGDFVIPDSGSQSRYQTVPLLDGLGRPVAHRFSGEQTVRLTALTGANQVQLNYLLLVPDPSAPAQLPPYIFSATPTAGETNVPMDPTIRVQIRNRETSLVLNTLRLFLDDQELTGASTRFGTGAPDGGGVIEYRYPYPTYLAPDSEHTLRVEFRDNIDRTITETWKFRTRPVPTIPKTYKLNTPQQTSFQVKMHMARQNIALPNSSQRAEQQLAGTLIDSETGAPFVNLIASPDFEETDQINYDQFGVNTGLFWGDKVFPGTGSGDYNNLAMSAVIHVFVEAGLHRWAVNSDDGFIVSTGPLSNLRAMTLGLFEGGRPTAETRFDFLVEEAGVYPFRLLYYEGQGGANVEWYVINRRSGVPAILNNRIPTTFLKPIGSATDRGFRVQMAKAPQTANEADFPENSSRALAQLQSGIYDVQTGDVYPNEAAGPNGDGWYSEPHTINYNQSGASFGFLGGDRPFPGVDPALYGGDPEFMAMQVLTYLELPVGKHVFGIRSDDGFVLTAGSSLEIPDQYLLGSYDGPRGSFETEFEFNVHEAGLYPVRLVWFEKRGGADIEWYSIDPENNQRILINDPSHDKAIKAWQYRPGDRLMIDQLSRTGNQVQFRFFGKSGFFYDVEYTEDLGSNFWQPLPLHTGILGDGTYHVVIDLLNVPQRYYRIKQ